VTDRPKYSQSLMPGAISIVCNELGMLVCKRCDRVLKMNQLAFLTRTSPDEAFEGWCIDCSLTLSRWALLGAAAMGVTDDDQPDLGIAMFRL